MQRLTKVMNQYVSIRQARLSGIGLFIILLLINCSVLVEIASSQNSSTVEFKIEKKLEKRMNLFNKAKKYIKQGNIDSLKQIDDDIVRTFSFLDSWMQARRSVARGIRVRTGPNSKINRLTGEFLKKLMKADSQRTGLRMSWPFIMKQRSKTEKNIRLIEQFVSAHRQLFKKANVMFNNRATVSLPAMAQVYGPSKIELPEEGSEKISYILENIGTKSLNKIDLHIETTDGKIIEDVRTEPGQLTELSAGKAVQFYLYLNEKNMDHKVVNMVIKSDELRKVHPIRIIH